MQNPASHHLVQQVSGLLFTEEKLFYCSVLQELNI